MKIFLFYITFQSFNTGSAQFWLPVTIYLFSMQNAWVQTDRWTDGQTDQEQDRQTDRKTDWQTDNDKSRQTVWHWQTKANLIKEQNPCIQTDRQTNRKSDLQTDRYTDHQIVRQTMINLDRNVRHWQSKANLIKKSKIHEFRQTDRQIERQTDREEDRHTDRQTDWQTVSQTAQMTDQQTVRQTLINWHRKC